MICEICVDSVAGVRAAKVAGADRIELCAALLEGGITPSRGMIRQARAIDGIGLNVMIRPRGGDFLFDDDEMATMLSDVEIAKAEGADGVVIGLLTPEGEVDVARTRELISLARPLSVTFHRAFDMTRDPFKAIETLVGLGIDRVLTSGQEATVLEGLPLLAELIDRAGDRIVVMPGGGITSRNVERIVSAIKPREIHFASLDPAPSGMQFRRQHVFMGGELRPPEYDRLVTSAFLDPSCHDQGVGLKKRGRVQGVLFRMGESKSHSVRLLAVILRRRREVRAPHPSWPGLSRPSTSPGGKTLQEIVTTCSCATARWWQTFSISRVGSRRWPGRARP